MCTVQDVSRFALVWAGEACSGASARAPASGSLCSRRAQAHQQPCSKLAAARALADASCAAAALHNLAEWGVICFALLSDLPADGKPATRGWWFSQLWILLVSNWVGSLTALPGALWQAYPDAEKEDLIRSSLLQPCWTPALANR